MIQFHKVRTECRKRKNKWLHLPEKQVILEVGKRTKGVIHYMLYYVLECVPPVEWQEYGFFHDPEQGGWFQKLLIEGKGEKESINNEDQLQSDTQSQQNPGGGDTLNETSAATELNATKVMVQQQKIVKKVSDKQKALLEDSFFKRQYLSKDDIQYLKDNTNLQEQTIRGWFFRERIKNKRKLSRTENKENMEPSEAKIKT